MSEAQEKCAEVGGCDDVFVALSDHDLYRVFEVMFVRLSVDQTRLEYSRPFRPYSVDVSGNIGVHAASDVYRYRFA